MTTKRTDPHCESNLRTEDYQEVGYVYAGPVDVPSYHIPLDQLPPKFALYVRQARQRGMLKDSGVNIHPGLGRCDHCGSHYHDGLMLRHTPTDKLITVGWQCASERFDMSTAEFQRARHAKVVRALKARRSRFRRLRAFTRDNREVVRVLNKHRHTSNFVRSVRDQLRRDIKLSPKQIETVLGFEAKQAEFAAQRQAREAKRAAERAAQPAPARVVEGRIQVTGEVLSTREQESYYGYVQKMLVLDDRGFKIWGTVPRGVDVHIDYNKPRPRVAFTATVTQSDDDQHFGFFKRPAKASNI